VEILGGKRVPCPVCHGIGTVRAPLTTLLVDRPTDDLVAASDVDGPTEDHAIKRGGSLLRQGWLDHSRKIIEVEGLVDHLPSARGASIAGDKQ
jgi:hypothetical protein